MPASGPKDEKKWQEAKQQAAKSKGKSVSDLKDDDYAIVMSIYKNKKPDYFKKKSTLFVKSVVKLGARYPEVREAMNRLAAKDQHEKVLSGGQ
jgi:hypothetical protein